MKAAELLELASGWLRQHWPDALIIPEFPAASGAFARIDVVALTSTELVGVEIKGEGDTPSRLARQGYWYSNVATRMFLLPASSLYDRCYGKLPANWQPLKVQDDGSLPAPPGWAPQLWNSPHALVDILWADETRALARVLKADVMGCRGLDLSNRIAETIPMADIRREVLAMLRHRDWQRYNKRIIHHPEAA